MTAHCVVTETEMEDGWTRNVCTVHDHVEPCPANGQPAAGTAREFTDEHGRRRVLAVWRHQTHGQRDLLIHHGTVSGDRQHDQGPGCWCGPERVPGVACGCRG